MEELTYEEKLEMSDRPVFSAVAYLGHHYETKTVGSIRKARSCDVCGTHLVKGMSCSTDVFYGHSGEFPNITVCEACEDTHASDLHLVRTLRDGELPV